jgi:hypothetical protein
LGVNGMVPPFLLIPTILSVKYKGCLDLTHPDGL